MQALMAAIRQHPEQGREEQATAASIHSATAVAGSQRAGYPTPDLDAAELNGPFHIDNLRITDPSYRIAPTLHEIASRCQHIFQDRATEIYEELVNAVETKSSRIRAIENDLIDLFPRYYLFIKCQAAIYLLDHPSKETIRGVCDHAMERDLPPLPTDVKAWANLHPNAPFENTMNSWLETRLGKKIFVGALRRERTAELTWSQKPFSTVVEDHGGLRYTNYSERRLKQVQKAMLNVVIAIFFGIPVGVLALNLASPVAGVFLSVLFVFAASLLLSSFFHDPKLIFAMLIGYASLLANNLKR
ncbi:hypothetical protein HJFPF1_11345 [Paramyrothecium foliicola]|nr:hypothetical protein HJFPF1_11345 [Paramyrothecium foliicola]